MTSHLIGIDVGTGGTKVVVIDTAGGVVGTAEAPHPLSTPQPQWSEQDPADWWASTGVAIRRVLAETGIVSSDIAAIGFAGQMHGLVLLDDRGVVLRPAILWNDQRTAAECRTVHEVIGRDRMIEITGKPVVTGFTLPKLLWVRKHEPDVYRRTHHVMLPKDYVRFRLTGVHAIDAADASGTSLLDLTTRNWSDELLERLEVPRGWLPPVHESPAVVGTVTADAAAHTGLSAGTPVIAGAGDQAAEAIGCGVVQAGDVSMTVGTSGVVFAATPTPPADPEGAMHGFCHAAPGGWHVMGVMLSAGGSLRWYRDTCAPGLDYETLAREAADVPAGSEGLLFLPYLTGERTPHDDPEARAAFTGLTIRHTRGHLTRAVLEGVAFGLRDLYELVRKAGSGTGPVRLSGGGARSPLWRQIIADTLATPVVTLQVAEGAAFGAAVLASVAAGVYADMAMAVAACVHEGQRVEPSLDVGCYADAYPRYRALYPAVARA